jgi:hypothetical protein
MDHKIQEEVMSHTKELEEREPKKYEVVIKSTLDSTCGPNYQM